MVPIYGLQKTTLLDYPGHIASTIFFGHCNYRCPFCQNSSLLGSTITDTPISEQQLFSHLEKRKDILEGVCVTGGEPTLYKDLPLFLKRIKQLGYLIKLDTNGTNPTMLSELLDSDLVDYIAMDIKNSLSAYSISCGITSVDTTAVKQCVALLKTGNVPYEFRTTLVKEHHTLSTLTEIGEWLAGDSTYILQNYKDSDLVLCKGLHGFSDAELTAFKQHLLPYLPSTYIRGKDTYPLSAK